MCADLERPAPLRGEDAIRGHQRRARVIDVRRLRGDPIELNDGETLTARQRIARCRPHVESPEIEALEPT
jgi:hypothetical protein